MGGATLLTGGSPSSFGIDASCARVHNLIRDGGYHPRPGESIERRVNIHGRILDDECPHHHGHVSGSAVCFIAKIRHRRASGV
jgi:hypothetical protein